VAPTGWLALLPLPVLAATIIVAVLGMLDTSTLRTAWRYDRADALALLATAAGVHAARRRGRRRDRRAAVDGRLIWRASRPHIAVLGRIAGTEHFRNIERYPAETRRRAAAARRCRPVLRQRRGGQRVVSRTKLEAHAGTRHLVLVLSAVNAIDTSALFALGGL
jgi:SulP family sulfate permease